MTMIEDVGYFLVRNTSPDNPINIVPIKKWFLPEIILESKKDFFFSSKSKIGLQV